MYLSNNILQNSLNVYFRMFETITATFDESMYRVLYISKKCKTKQNILFHAFSDTVRIEIHKKWSVKRLEWNRKCIINQSKLLCHFDMVQYYHIPLKKV